LRRRPWAPDFARPDLRYRRNACGSRHLSLIRQPEHSSPVTGRVKLACRSRSRPHSLPGRRESSHARAARHAAITSASRSLVGELGSRAADPRATNLTACELSRRSPRRGVCDSHSSRLASSWPATPAADPLSVVLQFDRLKLSALEPSLNVVSRAVGRLSRNSDRGRGARRPVDLAAYRVVPPRERVPSAYEPFAPRRRGSSITKTPEGMR
jgi:hypothetical protein